MLRKRNRRAEPRGSQPSPSAGALDTDREHRCHVDHPSALVDRPSFSLAGWIAAPRGHIGDARLATETSTVRRLERRVRADVEAAFPGDDVHGFQEEVALEAVDDPSSLHIAWSAEGCEHRHPVSLRIDEPALATFTSRKRRKLERIRPLLRCSVCGGALTDLPGSLRCAGCGSTFGRTTTAFDLLSDEHVAYGGVLSTDNVSSHGYVPEVREVLDAAGDDSLVLDVGSGLRHEYLEQVVNLDVVGYPSTDVLAIGERLPFEDACFDAVISIAVLEHVRHPFECAAELVRVLRPGGTMVVMVPFLQPYHGYPDHYYNMSSNGLANLFGEKVEIVRQHVPDSGLPIWTLTWFLGEWARGLPEDVAASFREMRVGDLLDEAPAYLDRPFVTQLSGATNEILASTTCLVARRPTESG